MSDVRAVREVLAKIDLLQDKVNIGKATLAVLREENARLELLQGGERREVSEDLMPSVIDSVDSQIQIWEIEIQKLEKRVWLK